MFATELKAREKRLIAEQSAHVERLKQKAEKERIIEEKRRQREKEREEEKEKIREELENASRKEQERIDEITECNKGVFFSAMLHAMATDSQAIASKGIKRAEDKLQLPRSVGQILMDQGASRNGAMMFEVKTPGGCVTHAGLLDFSAAEGFVAIPKKVADCLWGVGGIPHGPVTITYKRLEKGSFVRFQPLNRGFHETVSESIREVLEHALMQCTALTEGDIVRVDCSVSAVQEPSISEHMEVDGGQSLTSNMPVVYNLLVQELLPCSAVSLIDTDMEAQVVPSLETEMALKRLEEEKEALEQQRKDNERLALQAIQLAHEEAKRKQVLEEQRKLEEENFVEQRKKELQATLPPEPEESCSDSATSILFRLPDGTKVCRRFLMKDKVGLLFHFCDANGAGGFSPASYRLVMQYPRRVIEPTMSLTVEAAGLVAGRQEAVVLEIIETI
ncbi:hypothetical protein CEUSTIGMA_g12645.t1 [Chlamydomonas eustigma]|uniref:UBX domain-containing protein n=1 Tax=Chlamydomonas eustigma TaxID=1157962 RepID=A0A250XQ90_9CHLO|nr:hypothetical protein CEUSTIGMA_g12645.t1 [Chlamydomonas eustigma]|eukprot:GAX85225.1 hypothetical protein CEUSTIGMA_g12645.t1 [Chlamydomonas eustigma]